MVKSIIRAIESLYVGKCTIIENKCNTDEITGFTDDIEEVVYKDIPCRLSFKAISSTEQSESKNNISQEIKLFISNDVEIKAGSKITVTQNGTTQDYCKSGVPSIYQSHREYILKLYKQEA